MAAMVALRERKGAVDYVNELSRLTTDLLSA